MRTIELGVTITDAAVDDGQATIFCAPVARDPHCPDCGQAGRYRDTVVRSLTDLPVAGYPLVLRVAVPRYRCTSVGCGRAVFNQDLGKLAAPRSSTTRRCARYVLRRLMIDRTTISAIAAELGLSWHTVSTIAMRSVASLIALAGPERLDGVQVIGVDEHRWAPRRRGTEGFVTLIIDLTPVRDGTGSARLLDLVAGRSAAALSTWLAEQPSAFREQVEVIAMDGFGGYKSAAAEALPEATAVMDPFHVVALAGAKLDLIRQRIQQLTCGHRGRSGDPLYGVRRTLRTRFPLLTSRQRARLEAVFADGNHLAVQVTWSVYQRIIAAYGHPDPRRGKTMLTAVIDSLRRGVPAILLYSAIARPGNSGGPIVANDGRVIGLLVEDSLPATRAGAADYQPPQPATLESRMERLEVEVEELKTQTRASNFYRGIPASEVIRAHHGLNFRGLARLDARPVHR